ncbi:MAG: hypothetical protein QXN01_00005, partial [Candidatus Anstonellales archaeon]
MRKLSFFLVFFLFLFSFPRAQIENISNALTDLCSFISNLLPTISMIMVIGAGLVYAGGQLMGAEMRARSSLWSTSLLMGALIGILISVIAPAVLETIYGQQWNLS